MTFCAMYVDINVNTTINAIQCQTTKECNPILGLSRNALTTLLQKGYHLLVFFNVFPPYGNNQANVYVHTWNLHILL